jgi:hypothetical protein
LADISRFYPSLLAQDKILGGYVRIYNNIDGYDISTKLLNPFVAVV